MIGKPDPIAGEIVKAFVTLKPGFEPTRSCAASCSASRAQRLGAGRGAEGDRLRPAPAADAQRQDHAPPAQGARARPARGRHLDAGKRGAMTRKLPTSRGSSRAHCARAAAADAAHPPLRGEVRRALQRSRRSAASCTSTIGEEAVAVGVIAGAASRATRVVATYREHGHALARGVPMDAIMAEMFGKQRGLQPRPRRLDAPLRRAHPLLRRQRDRRRRAAARGRPRARPTACAARTRVTACFFGDGAVAEGEFHESLNLAALWQLPVLFCARTTSTRWARRWSGLGVARPTSRARPRLRHAVRAVDGMDVLAVGSRRAARRRSGARERRAVLPRMPHLPLPRPLDVRPRRTATRPRSRPGGTRSRSTRFAGWLERRAT